MTWCIRPLLVGEHLGNDVHRAEDSSEARYGCDYGLAAHSGSRRCDHRLKKSVDYQPYYDCERNHLSSSYVRASCPDHGNPKSVVDRLLSFILYS